MFEESEAPSDILLDCVPFGVAFHPSADVMAVGLVSGDVGVYRYAANEEPQPLHKVGQHSAACRDLAFSPDGNHLFTVSSDMSLKGLDVHSRQFAVNNPRAHKHPINKLIFLRHDSIATGDDDGNVSIWDLRDPRKAVHTFSEHADQVTGLAFNADEATLLSCASDGYLAAYDLSKTKKPVATVSEGGLTELTGIQLLQDSKSVVCSASNGNLLTFTWGKWDTPQGKLGGHPSEITAICPLFPGNSGSELLTADGDGVVRAVRVFPTPSLLAAAGEFEDAEVELMRLSRDGRFAACAAHDNKIHWLDIKAILKSCEQAGTGDSGFFCEAVEPDLRKRNRKGKGADDFDEDEDEDEDSDDASADGDDVDMEEAPTKRPRSSQRVAMSARQVKHSEFFKGLK
eukprot:TRINITY_DN80370_c0_g1_i1.p1 TRINITY_DN80370_c0_g1~~TRINITY_DN80370_c0_g1_i1.p1  ORF type:complete len:400 (-),score=72.80 TRINITY_DN80370_c0_g1_i1:74-1273(-)